MQFGMLICITTCPCIIMYIGPGDGVEVSGILLGKYVCKYRKLTYAESTAVCQLNKYYKLCNMYHN